MSYSIITGGHNREVGLPSGHPSIHEFWWTLANSRLKLLNVDDNNFCRLEKTLMRKIAPKIVSLRNFPSRIRFLPDVYGEIEAVSSVEEIKMRSSAFIAPPPDHTPSLGAAIKVNISQELFPQLRKLEISYHAFKDGSNFSELCHCLPGLEEFHIFSDFVGTSSDEAAISELLAPLLQLKSTELYYL